MKLSSIYTLIIILLPEWTFTFKSVSGYYHSHTRHLNRSPTEIYFERDSDSIGIRIPRDIWGTLCFRKAKEHNAENEPKFVLFTRRNLNDSEIVLKDDGDISGVFDPLSPTKVIIHGWKSDIELTPLVDMKNEYLARDQYNVIFVDWEKLADDDCYLHAINHCRYVGKKLSLMIERLHAIGNKNIHLIGFSLGAHVTGYASNYLSFKLPRITGLDPAMPGFITVTNENKLDANDAEFVDVYHTNSLMQGKLERCGKVDFYMNGGANQPGCGIDSNCDHLRAVKYFAESINSDIGFWGWPCTNVWSFMWHKCVPSKRVLAGDKVSEDIRGYYAVPTNSKSPFAPAKI